MTTCAKEGCSRTAEVVPKLLVPHVAGMPVDPKRQHGIMFGMKLCRRCSMTLNVADYVAQPNIIGFFRELARAQAKRFGLPYHEPDFARAVFTRVPLGSSEYRRLAPRLESAPRPIDAPLATLDGNPVPG